MTPEEFSSLVWDYYAKNSRDSLPWRIPEPDGSFEPYKILVSEIMLQQTQVSRVIEKYNHWMRLFPTVESLAGAPLASVLREWLGLGYNRRAKFLHEAAKQIVAQGTFPQDRSQLVKLPGVGVNTAGAVQAHAFNQPVVFVETNIRTVFLYNFFENQEQVSDAQLMPFIESTIDRENPREWYWALMDYGSYLKQTKGNFSKNSKHHVKQSAFEGSRRQVRGKILVLLAENKFLHETVISEAINDKRLSSVLQDLQKEGLITQNPGSFSLAE